MFETELSGYVTCLSTKGRSRQTIQTNQSRLKPFFSYLASRKIVFIQEVTKAHIQEYQQYLKEGYRTNKGVCVSEATYCGCISALRSFFRWLESSGQILRNPAVITRKLNSRTPTALPRYLSPQDIVQVLEAFSPTHHIGLRNRAVLELLYCTGIRRGELLNVNVNDFHPEERELVIVDGKGRKDRVVPVGEYAVYFTVAYLKLIRPWMVRSQSERALFVDHYKGGRLSAATVRRIVGDAVKRSGIHKHVTPHTIRHSMVTHMLRNKADLRHIQAILGHASLKSTQLYTHVSVEDLKEVMRSAHPHGKRKPRESVDS